MNKFNSSNDRSEWKPIDSQIFWGEIAPFDHVVQIYEKEDDFLDLLENYVLGGINAKDSVIFIATSAHLKSLENRLEIQGLNIDALISGNQYFGLDAGKTLATFMINGFPDETLFMNAVSALTKNARKDNRNVRAFGEMVALLWAKGDTEATVRLEYLWNKFCEKENLTLFCAYPKADLTESPSSSVMNICCAHSKIITGNNKSKTELFYKNTEYHKAV